MLGVLELEMIELSLQLVDPGRENETAPVSWPWNGGTEGWRSGLTGLSDYQSPPNGPTWAGLFGLGELDFRSWCSLDTFCPYPGCVLQFLWSFKGPISWDKVRVDTLNQSSQLTCQSNERSHSTICSVGQACPLSRSSARDWLASNRLSASNRIDWR